MVDFSVYTIIGSIFAVIYGFALLVTSRDRGTGIFIAALTVALSDFVPIHITVIMAIFGIAMIAKVLIADEMTLRPQPISVRTDNN